MSKNKNSPLIWRNSNSLDALIDGLGGIVPVVGNIFEPLSKKDLREIEAKFDDEFPPIVVELLSRFGAFRFNEYVYYTPAKPFPKSYSKSNRGILGIFFGKYSKAYPKAKAISLARQIEIHKGDFETDFLPIADNGGGDIIGVRLSDGAVELWVHDAPKGKEIARTNASLD